MPHTSLAPLGVTMEGGGCSGRQATRIRCVHGAAYWMAIFSGFTPDWPTPLL